MDLIRVWKGERQWLPNLARPPQLRDVLPHINELSQRFRVRRLRQGSLILAADDDVAKVEH
jgi:hypothetical protein